MSTFQVIMPKMGESIQEATITKMFIKLNDYVEEEAILFEIATDKVDSEIPSPVSGKIIEIRYKEEDVVPVGEVVAVIDTNGGEDKVAVEEEPVGTMEQQQVETNFVFAQESPVNKIQDRKLPAGRFYSPLVKSIAKNEKISLEELESIQGHGKNGRVQKQDILNFLAQRDSGKLAAGQVSAKTIKEEKPVDKPKVSASVGAEDQIIEMDRMRRIIADHMVMSKQTSPHVTSVVEADVTNMVLWRNKIKDEFFAKEKTKLTFMPVFIEATAKAIREFPMINSSVDGYKIIQKQHINIGIAVALPTGNLIVPVIKSADYKNLAGLANEMNRLATDARTNKLNPDDIQGGTFTISNFGTFRNIIGTPIINQPQVAILAVGAIEKKPAVITTSVGDVIVPRHKMFLSLSYDHRVIDGAMGGAFLRKIADHLENFDSNRSI